MITQMPDGKIRVLQSDKYGEATTLLNQDTIAALREYFQAERDEQLGRWRDPQNPDMVCYPVAGDLDDIWVVYEGTGLAYMRERDQAFYAGNAFSEVARRYFEAHPEPKPWDAAQPDEIWVLTIHGCEQPVYVTEFCGEPAFQVPGGGTMSLSHGAITAGRRIWPGGGDK